MGYRIYIVEWKFGQGVIASYELARETKKMYYLKLDTRETHFGRVIYQPSRVHKSSLQVCLALAEARRLLIAKLQEQRDGVEAKLGRLDVQLVSLRAAQEKALNNPELDTMNDELFG
jgi:hypothetical protein